MGCANRHINLTSSYSPQGQGFVMTGLACEMIQQQRRRLPKATFCLIVCLEQLPTPQALLVKSAPLPLGRASPVMFILVLLTIRPPLWSTLSAQICLWVCK
jgi:hypothetical protein